MDNKKIDLGSLLVGFVMLCSGFFMLFSRITVSSSFGLGSNIYRFGTASNGFGLTTGMIFIPLIIGIFWIFYNGKSIVGWLTAIGSISAMLFGVISKLKITMMPMNSFDLITILVLSFGGTALFLRSLKISNIKEIEIKKD